MLTITVPAVDMFDDRTQEFISSDEVTMELEHSLISLSKWESEFEKPFLGKDLKTNEEMLAYIRLMTLTPGIDPLVYQRLSQDNYAAINTYLKSKMTATWFREMPGTRAGASEIITSELIYYWMVALQIPFECENWHLNRLFTLIKVCNEKNKPSKKMSRKDAAAQQRALNEARRRQFGTSG